MIEITVASCLRNIFDDFTALLLLVFGISFDDSTALLLLVLGISFDDCNHCCFLSWEYF